MLIADCRLVFTYISDDGSEVISKDRAAVIVNGKWFYFLLVKSIFNYLISDLDS